jgi:hypothetical protein
MSENVNVRLFIAVSSHRSWCIHFASSLLGLIYRLGKVGLGEGFNLESFTVKILGNASCLSMSREANLREALDKGYTHILMFDDDMIFPDDTLEHLLSHKKSIVACNYMKKGNGEPTAQNMEGKLINSAERTGIESVYSVGLGVVLIELDAIRHVGAPHFAVMWDETRKCYWGEDLYFCELVRGSEPPVEIWCDHDLSKSGISHVGDYGYSFKDLPVKEVELAEAAE